MPTFSRPETKQCTHFHEFFKLPSSLSNRHYPSALTLLLMKGHIEIFPTKQTTRVIATKCVRLLLMKKHYRRIEYNTFFSIFTQVCAHMYFCPPIQIGEVVLLCNVLVYTFVIIFLGNDIEVELVLKK